MTRQATENHRAVRKAERLTDIKVRNLRPRDEEYEVPDAAQRGLRVVVNPNGSKPYAVRFRAPRADGKKHQEKMTFPGVTLAQARKLASDVMFAVAQGRNPAEERSAQRKQAKHAKPDTLRAVCAEYLQRPEHKRLRTIRAREATLVRHVYPVLGDRDINTIKRSDIARLLDKVEDLSGSVMADETLGFVSHILNWHAKRSDEFRIPIVKGMRRTRPKERARSRVLSDDELRRVWLTAEASDSPFSKLVQLLLLTCARRSEASRMAWAELENGDWVLPPLRNKTGLLLVRPLSAAAQELLAKLPRIGDCPFVVTTNGRTAISGFSRLKARFDAASRVSGWRLHDLRRSARSLMSRAGVNPDHAERCLGHVIGGVRGTYDRHEFYAEKKHAFEALAAQIQRIVNPQDNVLQLRT
jgi:integrase